MEEAFIERERLSSVADLVEVAGQMVSSTVVIAGGDRAEDLRLVESARDHGIIDRIILVGKKNNIREAVDALGIEIPDKDVVDAQSDEAVASATVELIRASSVNIVLKGNISTPIINRHMISLAIRPTVSLASIFDAAPIADGRPIILTDAGVTTVCNFGRMVDLIQNAVEVAHLVMGIERPLVAILSANEKQIPSLPSTWIGEKLSKRNWQDAVVYGPLSFDLATDPRSVAIKGLPDLPDAREVAGQADILVCPGIDAANILYKTISALCKYGEASIAGITVGFPVPYIILSRSDSLDTRLESIALCSIYAQRKLLEKKRRTAPSISRTYRVLCLTREEDSVYWMIYENEQRVSTNHFPIPSPPPKGKDLVEAFVAHMKTWLKNQGPKSGIDAVAVAEGCMPAVAHPISRGLLVLSDPTSVLDNYTLQASFFRGKEGTGPLLPSAAALSASLGVPAFFTWAFAEKDTPPADELLLFLNAPSEGKIPLLSIQEGMKRAAQLALRPVEDLTLVVAYLDSSCTVAAVVGGEVEDSVTLFQEGMKVPGNAERYAPERETPVREQAGKIGGSGPLDSDLIERLALSNEPALQHAFKGLVHRITGEIGKMFVIAGCDVETIVLSGRLLESECLKDSLRHSVGKLAPVLVLKGNLVSDALASRTVAILSGSTKPLFQSQWKVHSHKEKEK